MLIVVQDLRAQEPAVLQIRIIEGEGAAYPAGARATRGITVQVTDEIGRPVGNATVSFRLPADGPGGVFATGGKSDIATTGADGRASVWGMQWNHTAGSFEIRITAAKGQIRAGAVSLQYLTESREPSSHPKIGGGHKWLWISAAAVAAALGGAAAVSLAGRSSGSSTTPSGAVQIGTPSISLGHP